MCLHLTTAKTQLARFSFDLFKVKKTDSCLFIESESCWTGLIPGLVIIQEYSVLYELGSQADTVLINLITSRLCGHHCIWAEFPTFFFLTNIDS